MSMNEELCLVTGASRGIGQAIALELGKRGATLIGTATSETGAEAIGALLTENNITGAGKVLDVTDTDSIAAFLKDVQDNYGTPTVLVNNAGITRDNLLMRMKDEEWDAVIQTNLTSAFRMSKACLRGMVKAKRGRIITITSVIGATDRMRPRRLFPKPLSVIGFTKSLAREVGSRGITANTVAPGFIDTDMTRALPAEQRDRLLEQIPLARLGDVSDIANAVALLASADASYITGETIHVNGGMYMA